MLVCKQATCEAENRLKLVGTVKTQAASRIAFKEVVEDVEVALVGELIDNSSLLKQVLGDGGAHHCKMSQSHINQPQHGLAVWQCRHSEKVELCTG